MTCISCVPGHQVKACQVNHTEDTCEPCKTAYNQSQRTSSYTMDQQKCHTWPLDSNCNQKNINPPKNNRNPDENMKRCLCNIEQGMIYKRPEVFSPSLPSANCQKMKKKCKPGEEPHVNGKSSSINNICFFKPLQKHLKLRALPQ